MTLSTNINSTTTAKWQSNSNELSRSQSALISNHWTNITRHLAPPGVAWEWSESDINHRVKYRWKCDGLIHRSADGDRWETSMSLWCHVIEQASPNERVGEDAQGQQVLNVPPASGESRFVTNTNTVPDTVVGSTQPTLIGDRVTDTTPDAETHEELVEENTLKDPTRPSYRKITADHPVQARLSVWAREDGINTDRWNVDTSRTKGEVPLSEPCGRVYYPAGDSTQAADAPSASPGQATLTAFARQWRVTVSG